MLYFRTFECFEYHRGAVVGNKEDLPNLIQCPKCGAELCGFEDCEVIEDHPSFVIEPAACKGLNGRVFGERRYMLALQTRDGRCITRSPRNYSWDEAIAELQKLQTIPLKKLQELNPINQWVLFDEALSINKKKTHT